MRGPVRRAVARAHFLLACLVGGLAFVGLSLGGLLYVALRPRGKRARPPVAELHWIMRASSAGGSRSRTAATSPSRPRPS